jgi:hypothetical protein
LFKATHYLNPTYNSKISLCINDDYITIVDDENNKNNINSHGYINNSITANSDRDPSSLFNNNLTENERESNALDENMNHHDMGLIKAIESNNRCKVPKNLAGKLRNEFIELSFNSIIKYSLTHSHTNSFKSFFIIVFLFRSVLDHFLAHYFIYLSFQCSFFH